MYVVFAVLSVIASLGILVGVITMAIPIRAIGIPTRERAMAVTFFSVVGSGAFAVCAAISYGLSLVR